MLKNIEESNETSIVWKGQKYFSSSTKYRERQAYDIEIKTRIKV